MLRDGSKLGLLLALLCAAGMWTYVQRVLVPYQQADAARHDRPRGNLSDLYPRWLGARELLLHGRDPYSAEVTREIQVDYYGRVLDPARPGDPKDQQGFAYPVYVVFLLAPTVKLPFAVVQTGFRWLLVLITVALVPQCLHIIRWRPSFITVVILLLLTLSSFPAVQGIKLQQLSVLDSGLIAGSVALLVSGQFVSAGILLALATIKPQLALPLAAWLLVWAVGDFRRRQGFAWGFAGTLAALFAGAEFILPGWLGRFRMAITAYRQYTGGGGSLLDVLLGPMVGRVMAALVVLAVAVVCWRWRREAAQSSAFALSVALVLAATVVVVPMVAPYNQLLLLPAIFLITRHWRVLWDRGFVVRLGCMVAAVAVFWPWLAAIGLSVASLLVAPDAVQARWVLPLYSSLAIPPAVLAVLWCVGVEPEPDKQQS